MMAMATRVGDGAIKATARPMLPTDMRDAAASAGESVAAADVDDELEPELLLLLLLLSLLGLTLSCAAS